MSALTQASLAIAFEQTCVAKRPNLQGLTQRIDDRYVNRIAGLALAQGLPGDDSIAEPCRKEGIAWSLFYTSSKEFLEADTGVPPARGG